MKSLMDRIRKLCTPAYVYLVISAIALIMMAIQNVGSNSQYCAGSYSCAVGNTALIFIVKMLYVIFWTWILNLICKAGAPTVSWVLVLLPFVLMFLFIALYILGGARYIPTTMGGIV